MLWSNIRRALLLQLMGNIPWLLIVPIVAAALEFVNAKFGTAVRIPLIVFLMFAIAVAFAAAAGIYAFFCPPGIRGIGSLDDWRAQRVKVRKQLADELEQNESLRKRLYDQVETRVEASLSAIKGKHAFTPEQIAAIKYSIMEEARIDRDLKECLEAVAETSVETFNALNRQRPVLRNICAGLIGIAFGLLLLQIGIRLVNVFHQTFG